MSNYFGADTPKLGFGLMRLPKQDDHTDIPQVEQMVDRFLDAGFTYFDTAFVYGTSEEDIRRALVDRYPRDRYTLATKLHATIMATNEKEAKQEFYTSLRRTGAGYFDYYLLHALMDNNYKKYDQYHLWDFVAEQKEKGLIKHMGFSFHGGPALLDRLLTAHPEVDFVQLQLNYADWENPAITSRANYEVARKHGKSIVVMEPIKGGTLANPPQEVRKLFRDCRPDLTDASWAIRFAASLEGIITVLSGMSTLAQMEDNLSYMKDFRPLDEKEQRVIQEAQRLLGHSATIPCTACRYCTKGCPKEIPIPDIFAAANYQLGNGQRDQAIRAYQAAVRIGHTPSDCIGCKQCERACPQHLPITDDLKRCADLFGV